jgi:hypothetical protein
MYSTFGIDINPALIKKTYARMNKRKDIRIRYTCGGYSSAPESFKAYRVFIDQSGRGNHTYQLINLSRDKAWEVGYCCITQGKEKAEIFIKRLVREYEKKQSPLLTYGYFVKEWPTTYLFIKERYVNADAPIADRLSLYKKMKEHFAENPQHVASQTATLGAGGVVESVKETVYTADFTRPVIIHFKQEKLFAA